MDELYEEILNMLENPKPGSLKIILDTQYAKKINPSFEDIEQAIYDLAADSDNFVVLERYPLLKGCVYLQAAADFDKESCMGYFAETRMQTGDSFRHYRFRTCSMQEIINIFADFYIMQQLPPIDEWEDVTEEFEEQP